jgi:sigma-54 dependent transcriptional regulator, acetoin dehydrogenase operon transcriptional activator AcoR
LKKVPPKTGFHEVWNKFVSGGAMEQIPANIRPSWERCRKAQVNPLKEATLMRIDQRAIRKRIDDQLDLHQILRTHHKNIEKYFSFLPVGIFFADRDGYILSFAGDDKIFKRMEASSQTALIGSSIKEQVIGTTAPGICLEENRFAAVNAEEHYIQSIHWASCIATPIYDGEKKLLGALDFTVTLEDSEKLKQLIPILFSTASSIQFELSLKRKLDQLELFHSYYHSTFDYSLSILVLVDLRGMVIDLNQKAQEFFKVNYQEMNNRNVRTVLGNRSKVEILFKRSGGKIFLSGSHSDAFSAESIPIFDRSGEAIAFLLKLEKESVFKTIPERACPDSRYTFSNLIGASPQIVKVVEKARKAAITGSTILIEGETGTGKELFAQAIHSESPFKNGPFVALNCGAIPRDLVESELFGYEKGAYTGARQEGNTGKFELADRGTIFLDEIHLMDLPAQNKILRVIEDRRISRIGSKNDIPLDLRVIVASTENLNEAMAKGRFVPALFFRLNVVKLCLPPLRERKEDIPLLVDYFIAEMNRKFNRSIRGMEPEALKAISKYPWPGNVRELRNCLESASIFSRGETIALPEVLEVISLESKRMTGQGQTMEEVTKNLFVGTLERFGSVKEAADSLDIPLSTFYRKMKEFGLCV